MASHITDAKGRPVAVVTGLGLVTPLGRGVADNWAGLIAGRSGVRRITRFPTDGLKTTIAGTIDFMGLEPYNAVALSEAIALAAAEEAIAQAGIGGKARFPGPLFIATPPSEFEWPQLQRLYAAGDATAPGYQPLLAAARTGQFADMAAPLRFASIAEHLAVRFGTAARPSPSAPPVRPARPPSSSASRPSGAGKPAPPSASAPTPPCMSRG